MKSTLLSLILTFFAVGTFAQAPEKNSELLKLMVKKEPPAFLNNLEKLKLILAPDFKIPAGIKPFRETLSIDNNPIVLNNSQMTSANGNGSFVLIIAKADFVYPLQSIFTKENNGFIQIGTALNINDNNNDEVLYLFEMNVFSLWRTMFTFSCNYPTPQTITVSPLKQGDPYEQKYVFTLLMAQGSEITISPAYPYPPKWTFENIQITKINQ